ncbi:hypothetical protein SK128_028111 [Halocaridina rubra]|uniref:Ig-like domain-containing protein n=1 Tax=Halocaridina rubra TaxID=373956 RepID=A0AAN8XNU0_HALRR
MSNPSFIVIRQVLAVACLKETYKTHHFIYILRQHDTNLVSYDRTRSGVVVSTEKGVVTTSRLLVQLAEPRHTGVYTCSPANSDPKSVNVHVLAGDKPAAIVHENNSAEVMVSLPHIYNYVFTTGLVLLHRITL